MAELIGTINVLLQWSEVPGIVFINILTSTHDNTTVITCMWFSLKTVTSIFQTHLTVKARHHALCKCSWLTFPSSVRKLSSDSSFNFPTSNMVTAWLFRPCMTMNPLMQTTEYIEVISRPETDENQPDKPNIYHAHSSTVIFQKE